MLLFKALVSRVSHVLNKYRQLKVIHETWRLYLIFFPFHLRSKEILHPIAVSIYFTRFTHFQVPNVAASMHAQQYNLYGKWDQIMASLNVMAALKGNVTVNSCQIMDHAEVSQLH